MSIRLLALDLDGTLLNSKGWLSDGNRSALERARKRGVRIAVVTGRRFRDARPLALELGVDVPLIAHNGALTKHAATLETVAVLPLPLAAAQAALRVGRAAGAGGLVSDDYEGLGVMVYDRLNGENKPLKKYIAWAKRVHGEEAAHAIREVESLESYLDHDPIHLAFSGTYQAMTALYNTLQRAVGGTVKLFRTMYPQLDFGLLDIVHPQASKGVGVAAAAAELNLMPDEVMAIGDNFNDLEMLHYAGTGVVMANADPELRQIEGLHPTATNDEDGVALAIEKFILSDVATQNQV